ncbi:unnamed protein product [Brassica rapa]|uniref:Uncharacterized protein n=2 Tax=Brassica campestris TaxID=3711 RepID=A0A3P5YIN1_BRACM|nr:unnamed protein product [Brassica rapa]VDC60721.1 unnamed protein product [Brassica rapa]
MAKKISLLIFLFVLSTIIAVVSSQRCSGTGSFGEDSKYAINRENILSSLASNVKIHHGFYNGTMGGGPESPNRVYAMAMCIDGSDPEVCSECLKVATDLLIHSCNNESEGFIWFPYKTLCFARFSDHSFFGNHDTHLLYSGHSSGLSRLTEFDQNFSNLTDGMIVELSRGKKAATNGEALTKFQTLHALMLCTPDLPSSNCSACLRESVDVYHRVEDLIRKHGGVIAYPSCFFRWDLYPFSEGFTQSSKKISTLMFVAVVVPIVAICCILSALVVILFIRRRRSNPPPDFPNVPKNSLQYDLKTIEAATCTFSKRNMLGEGGFGEVFKGSLQDGSQIAVKRLSKESAQGVQEFKNETSLVAKLQHRNLVGVLGFCMEGEEKILIYEFVPNKSLDQFLFEPTKQSQLDWAKRYKIILGTARGILYLHHDSPLKIVHRDLKASNILLDAEMEPKVADFGMARILKMDQSRADTRRVVGTHGYISPEYLMHGQFSRKSDIFSFGVLILEIISGKRNSNFHEIDGGSGKSLVTHAWRHWRNGSPLELVDAEIGKNYQSNEVVRCIHIALLCVHADPDDRPDISEIISMLTSNSIILQLPQSPVYEGSEMGLPPIKSVPVSVNDSLINELVPR